MGKHGKQDFVQSAVNKMTRNMLPVTPFEKRVLMDAVLDWDIGGLEQVTTLISGIHHMLDAQMDGYGDFLDTFDSLTDGALQALDIMGDANGRADTQNHDALADMMDRMREVITQIKAGSLTMLDTLVGDGNTDFDADLETGIENALIGLLAPATGGANAAANAAQDSANQAAIRSAVLKTDIAATFNLAAFAGNTVEDNIDDFLSGLSSDLTGLGISAAAARTAVKDTADSYFDGLLGDGLSINLDDITIGGNTVVSFAQVGAGHANVAVTVHLPSFGLDMDALLDIGLDGAASPISLQFDAAEDSISFNLHSFVEVTGAVVDSIGIDITDFEFAPLFELGGVVDITGLDASINLGLLTAEVTAIETAKLRATVVVDADLNLGGQFNFTATNGAVGLEFFATDPDLNILVEIDKIESGAAVAGFVEVQQDVEYTLFSVDLGGSLNFFSNADDAADTAQTYTAAVTVSSILDDSTANTAALQVAHFISNAKIDFSVDLSGAVEHEELRETLEDSIEALAAMGIDQITGFLKNVGNLVADVLDAVTVDVDIPFTDIEIHDVIDTINGVFTGLADMFVVSPADLGYADGVPSVTSLVAEVAVQTSDEIDFTALSDAVADYASVTVVVVTRSAGATAGAADTIDRQEVVIDLDADAVWTDVAASDADRLDALVAMLNTGLGGSGFTFTLVDGALNVAMDPAAHPGRSLGLLGALRRDEDPGLDGNGDPLPIIVGEFDDTFDLAALGFTDANYTVAAGLVTAGAEEEQVLTFNAAVTADFIPGDAFDEAMVGVEALRYVVTLDGETIDLVIEKPDDGWYDPANGDANLAGMIDAFNAAFGDADLPISAALNSAGDGIIFALEEGSEGEFAFGIDPDKLTRALDLDTLIEWVNVRLNDADLLEGSTLKLTEEGKLMFLFPTLENTINIGSGDASTGFSAEDMGAGLLGGLSLNARLNAALHARFDASVGIDLLGFAADLIAGGTADNALEAKKEAKADAEAAADLADAADTIEGNVSVVDVLLDAVLDNVFFSDLALAIDVTGTATGITGGADLGLMAVQIGRDHAELNFITLSAQMDVTLVGHNDTDGFVNEVSLRNLMDAVTYKNADGEYDSLRGLNGLIGRTDFQGGIVTDGDGNALDLVGDAVTDAGDVRVVDADDYVLQNGEVLSMLHVYLGNVSVDTIGISGLNEGFIDGVTIVVDNLLHPLDTLSYQLIGDGAESVEAMANLGQGDILDSFSTIASMLQVLGGALKEKLPFLDQDIPLLNFSLLDAVDFAKDFSEALKDMRDDPSLGLAKADEFLEQFFGEGTIELTWDSDAKTLVFALNLEFLRDYSKEIAFNFDLDEILGDSLTEMLGETVANLVTGLVDVAGDGKLVFDPDLTLNFTFGIDLSDTLKPLTVIAAEETLLSDLNTVGTLTQSNRSTAAGTPDLQIRWKDADLGTNEFIRIDVDGVDTLGDLIAKISDAVTDTFGTSVTFEFDAATGEITLSDSNADMADYTDVTALFGEAEVISVAGAALTDDLATADVDESEGFVPQFLALADDFTDFAAAFAFTLGFSLDDGESFGGEGVVVEIAADGARLTAQDFADALNAAFAALDIPRSDINGNAVDAWTIALSQILTVSVVDHVVTIETTNFTDAIGADAVVFGVTGIDISHEVTFTLTELGGSNALALLGFAATGEPISGSVTSEALYQGNDIGAPRVYLDTQASGILLEMTAGAPDGLNLKLGLGPIAVNVVDGSAQLTAGAGQTGPAFLNIGFVDVDGDAHVGQYDLSDLFAIAGDDDRSFADVLSLDLGIGLLVDLHFEDSLGLMDPAVHGLSYTTDLVTTGGPVAFSDIDFDDLTNTFSGDLINIYTGDALEGEFELNLPDLTNFLSDFNILALLNNPRAVLDGLDMILDQMQAVFDDYLGGIDLPVVGDAIGSSVTFFDDFRYNIIEKARVIAETPMANGELPTTVDLITGWLNDQLNALFNDGNPPIQFIQAYLNTDGGTTDSYLYGSINFGATIFDEMLDISLDLGIPGFDLEVKEGSELNLKLGYSVNIGFGLDKNGFFLLNDTDEKEIEIKFIADAGSFEGSMSLLNILGVKAEGVNISNSGIVTGVGNGDGTIEVTATLGAALFGDDGMDIVDGTAGDDEVSMDLSGIDLKNGVGQTLEFEKVVYLSKIDTSQLISFSFNAAVDIQIGLEANILDPTTGEPIEIAGANVIPSVKTEVIFQGFYDSAEHDLGFQIEKLGFENVRIDASVLYEAIIKPVIDPIMEFVSPLADALEWMNEAPFVYLKDILASAFPIFGIITSIADTIISINNFVDTLNANGGEFIFGDFDFTDSVQDGGKVDAAKADRNDSHATHASGTAGNPFGVFGNTQRGFSIEIPLLTDPFSAINLLTGDFDKVDLIKVNVTLLNFVLPRTDIVQLVLEAADAPSWVSKIIRNVLEASVEARLVAKFTMGYDLGGIVNFVNTLDPERLLDGVFFDSAPGSLLDVFFGFDFKLDLGVAGISGGAHGGVQLAFNDPNDDGKLRIPELLAIFEAIGDDPENFLGYLFDGTLDYGANLSIWAGVRLPWPLPDLIFDVDLFDFGDTIPFGGFELPAKISQEVDAGDTAILNVGARAGGNMTSMDEDGDDSITISGPHSPIQVGVSNEFGNINGSFNQAAGGLIIPAGEGNNTINLSALTFGKPVIVYTGGGTDTIVLPNMGLNVIFAGDGTDTITQTGASTGTYVIFGGAGADKVNIQNGNVIYFGDSDFGMRDRFMTAFANGGLTDALILSMLGINADGTVAGGGIYNATDASGAAVQLSLSGLLTRYTELTQLNAENKVETVTLGAGNHVILTGRGADLITTSGSTGTVKIYSGDGADVITAGGANLFVEAGAGSDRVFTNAGTAEVWGWGMAAGEAGTIGTAAGRPIDTLSQQDGADLMVGGAGDDKFHGQIGNDLLEGGMGNDTLSGGLGVDLITGGTFAITKVTGGAAVNLTSFNPAAGFGGGVNISVLDAADGHDSITGGLGGDILIGGGGNDTIDGGENADAIIGDFAKIRLSANLVAEAIETEFDTSNNAGTDNLSGGQGNDILIAGGSSVGFESITDLEGSNVVIGDFGKVSGARLSDAVTLVESRASSKGGADLITLGNGNDMALGGEGADTINMGLGGDIVVADLGKIDITNRLITGNGDASSGNDVISFGTAGSQDVTDILIAGLGDDSVTAGNGGLIMLGDDGTISVDTVALAALRSYAPLGSAATAQQIADDTAARLKISNLAKELVSSNTATDGRDSVTMSNGGFLRAVMGGGDDTAILADAASYVLADDGTLTILTNGVKLVSAESLKAGADSITSGTAADLIIGGAGNDTLVLGTGADVVLGDSGTIERTASAGATPVTTTKVTAAGTAFGDDSVTGGAGAKTVLLGLGNDVARLGDTGSLILGDNGQATLTGAVWVANTVGDVGGNDSITAGTGADIILAGNGYDTVSAGDGDNVIIADTGSWAANKIISASTLLDGADSITSGSGNDRVILGGGGDVADLGAGNNRVIGDSGTIDWATVETVTVSDVLIGGHDSITVGAGNDVVLAAAGNDTVAGGDGDNMILGDAGSWTPGTLISRSNTADGADSITSGSGNDRVILGGGGDVADLGAGNNRVIGDSGTITYGTSEQALVQDVTVGGADSITSGSGSDIVLGAIGADTIAAGDGDNLVIGDVGTVTLDAAGRASMVAEDTLNGGVDLITTGSGRDAIIAGLGGDSITSGAGDDAILGDLGRYTAASGTSDGTLQSLTVAPTSGADTISSGAGDDMVIAGLGNDSVNAGAGEDLVLGDNAYVTFAANADIAVITLSNVELGGDDLIVTEGASGDDIVIGQSGADNISTAGGEDLIVGDIARIVLTDPRTAASGQSAADRLSLLEGTRSDLGFNDSIFGGDGGDFILAGFGADSVDGMGGQDIVIGDSAIVVRGVATLAGGAVYEKFSIDSNFAFLTGGLDSIHGNAGADIMIGGLGSDLFFGDTAEDLLFSDSYAGIFNATYVNGFLTSPNPKRTLLTSNFAGPGAIDVVSEAQQNASIGNALDVILQSQTSNLVDLNKVFAEAEAQAALAAKAQEAQQTGRDQMEAIFDLLGSQDVLQAVAELLAAGAGQELISEALQNYLFSSGILSQDISPLQLELIMNAIVAQLTKTAMADTENAAQGTMRIAAE